VDELNGRFLCLHHVGFVVSSIDGVVGSFSRSLSGDWNGEIYHDPIQKVRVTFLSTPGTDVRIELIEPAGEESPVRAFLEQGGGLHHLCYEVKNCEAALAVMRQRRAMIVKRPKPAVAFQGRRIAWVLTAENLLLEFLETTAE
jgi:methylmalonyl-CoA/ethylmalonyl-CoA epimerase